MVSVPAVASDDHRHRRPPLPVPVRYDVRREGSQWVGVECARAVWRPEVDRVTVGCQRAPIDAFDDATRRHVDEGAVRKSNSGFYFPFHVWNTTVSTHFVILWYALRMLPPLHCLLVHMYLMQGYDHNNYCTRITIWRRSLTVDDVL